MAAMTEKGVKQYTIGQRNVMLKNYLKISTFT